MTCAVLVPEGKIAAGKLAQALIYGARVISLNGNFDVALQLVRDLADNHPISLVNSVNDFRLEGQKTASFEIVDEIGPIDLLTIPVGNAGNITAYWKGFKEYDESPELNGYQAAGAAPLVEGKPSSIPRLSPRRFASATRRAGKRRWPRSPNRAAQFAP